MSRAMKIAVIASILLLSSAQSQADSSAAGAENHFVRVHMLYEKLNQRQLTKLGPGVKVVGWANKGYGLSSTAYLEVPSHAKSQVTKALVGYDTQWTKGNIQVDFSIRGGDSYLQNAIATISAQDLNGLRRRSLVKGFAKPAKEPLRLALEHNTSDSAVVLLKSFQPKVKCSLKLATKPIF